MIENGHFSADAEALSSIADVLDCAVDYLLSDVADPSFDRPKLRAYADAPQRAVDRTVFDTIAAVEAIHALDLRLVPMNLPIYRGDLNDDEGIDRVAADLRESLGYDPDEAIPNVIRAAERLGCVVLPLDGELGRHWGMSLTINGLPVIRVTRPSHDPEFNIPGDRQRFTVAHELGHLILHSGATTPSSPSDASRMEREANRFAASFLVPGDAALADLAANGGRVTLSTLAALKRKWGYSIKAFVFRFRDLGEIDDGQARSLYKQISARRWNKDEPHRPGTEYAVWFGKALREKQLNMDGVEAASKLTGLGEAYIKRWSNWEPSGSPALTPAPVKQLRKRESTNSSVDLNAKISHLPRRP